MPCMYFSGKENNAINIDDPNTRCIRVNAAVYSRFQNFDEQNIESFWILIY